MLRLCVLPAAGMGCFWGAERLFWRLPGVFSTQVGYAGGFTPNPNYHEVCSGTARSDTRNALSTSTCFEVTPCDCPATRRRRLPGRPNQPLRQPGFKALKNATAVGEKSVCFKHGSLILSAPSLHLQSTTQNALLQMG